MSEEDVELRDVLMRKLEDSGMLGRIRAQLRATVLLALQDQSLNLNLQPFKSSSSHLPDEVIMLAIVDEALQSMGLTATHSIFLKESSPQALLKGKTHPEWKKLSSAASDRNRSPLSVLIQEYRESKDSFELKSIVKTPAVDEPSPPHTGIVKSGSEAFSLTLEKAKQESPFSSFTKLEKAKTQQDSPFSHLNKSEKAQIEQDSPFSQLNKAKTENIPAPSSISSLSNLPSLTPSSLPPLSSTNRLPPLSKPSSDILKALQSTPSSSPASTPRKEEYSSPAAINEKKIQVKNESKNQVVSSFKRQSPREEVEDSVSEEIVEDLEVGDILSSGRSNLSF